MELQSVEVLPSPRTPGSARLTGVITYDDGHPPETCWFDLAGAGPDSLTRSGNPWLACLAPVAATLGESLRLDVPVDAVLLENVRELLRIWTAWYPSLTRIEIEAEPAREDVAAAARMADRRTLSFFSGGVDSFFTALRHAAGEGTPRTESIDDLLFVHGFDIALGNEEANAAVVPALQSAAAALGHRLLRVTTNLRETRFSETDWSGLSHAAALAAIGLALEPGWDTALIPSSAGYRDLRFWGSHPLTDPLFSSSRTHIIHDGPAFMRVEKTEYVARSEIALRTLRVCWRSASGWNCNACNNCYRTMLTLEALGVLDRCATFDARRLDMKRAARVYCPHSYDIRQFGYVRDLALRCGRTDIVRAVDLSLARSARMARVIRRVRRLRSSRRFWRFAVPLERRLLRDWLI